VILAAPSVTGIATIIAAPLLSALVAVYIVRFSNSKASIQRAEDRQALKDEAERVAALTARDANNGSWQAMNATLTAANDKLETKLRETQDRLEVRVREVREESSRQVRQVQEEHLREIRLFKDQLDRAANKARDQDERIDELYRRLFEAGQGRV
jgi:glutamate-1-semialdehyde aminotransferase